MKKVLVYFRPIVALVAAILLFNNAAWAGYNIKLTVKVTGGGKIYAVKNGDADYSSDFSRYQTSDININVNDVSTGAEVTFDVYCAPNTRGKKLSTWGDVSKSQSGGTFGGLGAKGNKAEYASAFNDKTASHVQVKITAHTAGGTVNTITSIGTLTATFIDDSNNYQVQYDAAANGSYTVSAPYGTNGAYTSVTPGSSTRYLTYTGDAISLAATPAEDYNFIRFYTIDKDGNLKTLGTPFNASQTVSINNLTQTSGNVNVCAEFSQMPFAIGERTYATLDAALQAVKSSSTKVIRVLKNCSVDAGYYTIPAGVTLLVPKSLDQINPTPVLERQDAVKTNTCAIKLTLKSGVNIQVYGNIEAGGTQSPAAQGANGTGIPTGSYGQIEMLENATITLNSGANLYAWGFVTGAGTIDARRGSKVYEMFQMYDWKGGTLASGMIDNNSKVFPITQYFIQNVEASTTYHPGAELISCASVKIDVYTINSNSVKIIGSLNSGAMFLMDEADQSEDTWVRKSYNVSTDQQVYTVNSSASLGSMVIEFDVSGFSTVIKGILYAATGQWGNILFDSRNYDLPITNNLKIHLLDGTMGITQNTVMLPGAEIEIDKTSTVSINSGKSLYLYDQAEWDKYVFNNVSNVPSVYAQQVKYVPDNNDKPNKRPEAGSITIKPASAAMNVHGTFDVKGALYTTAGGANIFSSIADAGTVKFTSAAAGDKNVYQWQDVDNNNYVAAPCTSAKLANEEGSVYSEGDGFSETAGTPANKSFCFMDIDGDTKGEWVSLTTDGCFVYDSEKIYYAKPSDYVALKNGKTPNADHTYSSADGSRLFILICNDTQTDCQWWEVTYDTESGLYYCAKNETYYFYEEGTDEWIVKMCTIKWQNWDGYPIMDGENEVEYAVPYGSTPKYNHSTPSRQDDVGYYTYDFVGWAPAFTPVTSDVTYYVAQYERNPVMYTITWQNANGTEREVGYFQRDSMPVCRTQPADMSALEWNPAVAPVTGNAIYRLQAKTVKSNYTITWKNWNGSTLQTTTPAAGTSAANVLAGYTASEPTKPALDDIRFEFAGWSPTVAEATADAIYVAQFTEQPITFTILWKNYDGTTLETDENVAPNAVPQYNGTTPMKPSDEDNNYVFAGWNTTPVAATADATYMATYNAVPKDKIVDGETYNMDEGKQITLTNITITDDGIVNIPSTSRINADNLIIEATNTTSGQLITSMNTCMNASNAYFDLKVSIPTHTWYAIAVPWQVDAEDGISVNGRTLEFGKDFDILYYDGATRAANGANKTAWKYMEDEYEEGYRILQPGTLYMIGLMMDAPQGIRFTKKTGANILTTSTSVTAHGGNADAIHNGWNGIANPAVYHAYMNAGSNDQTYGANYGQIYDAEHNAYTSFDMEHRQLVVGQPIFVQVPTGKSIVVNRAEYAPSSAPVRRANAENRPENFEVSLSATNTSFTDKLIVRLDEDKEDTYVIGQDLAKMGVSSVVPQLWINRYDAKLCMNTQSLTNGVAEYPLSIYAPVAGDYTITNHQSPITNEDYTLYLTLDGQAIWNLSESPYTLTLGKGTATNYGLRISARAPQTATGTDEAIIDARGETKKVLINDKVYIIREGQLYSVDGRKVK